MPTEKYKEFRNFMFNELGITKDDVRQWTKEAAFEAAERTARSVDIEAVVAGKIEDAVRKIVTPQFGTPSRDVQNQIRRAIAETLAEKLVIGVKGD